MFRYHRVYHTLLIHRLKTFQGLLQKTCFAKEPLKVSNRHRDPLDFYHHRWGSIDLNQVKLNLPYSNLLAFKKVLPLRDHRHLQDPLLLRVHISKVLQQELEQLELDSLQRRPLLYLHTCSQQLPRGSFTLILFVLKTQCFLQTHHSLLNDQDRTYGTPLVLQYPLIPLEAYKVAELQPCLGREDYNSCLITCFCLTIFRYCSSLMS